MRPNLVTERSAVVGLGVGLYADYVLLSGGMFAGATFVTAQEGSDVVLDQQLVEGGPSR